MGTMEEILATNSTFLSKAGMVLVMLAPGIAIGIIASILKIAKEKKRGKEILRTGVISTLSSLLATIILNGAVNTPMFIVTVFCISYCGDWLLELIPGIVRHLLTRPVIVDEGELEKIEHESKDHNEEAKLFAEFEAWKEEQERKKRRDKEILEMINSTDQDENK